MRLLLLMASLLTVGGLTLAATPDPAAAGEELSDDDLDKLDAPAPGEKPRKALTFHVPTEHDYDRRLLALPALLVLMLAWNVNWKRVAAGRKT